MSKRAQVVREYFRAQDQGDTDGVVKLFANDATVFNAGFPPVKGQEGVKGFCENLYSRTSARQFTVLAIFENGDAAVAEWEVRMSFRAGANVAGHVLATGFEVQLRGMNKFDFKPNSDLVSCLRVFHETTSVGRLAKENAIEQ